MPKTETNVNVLKINRGTLAAISANLSSIGENELIITEDKNIPIPSASDAGKVIGIDSNGDYVLITPAPTIPSEISYLTTAPVADNTNGTLKFVVLSSEPATKYNGYIYIITESTPQGYSGNITTYQTAGGVNGGTSIKFDTAPASEDDYDAYADASGNITGLTSYSNKTKVYVWGGISAVTINNIETAGGSNYSNAVEITLTGNYDISLRCQINGGSND